MNSLFRRVPAINPYTLVMILTAISLITAPLIFYPFDNIECWCAWARESHGLIPWRIYLIRSDCNYPPFYLYWLTIAERLRLWFHVQDASLFAVCIMKIAPIGAHISGLMLLYHILRRPLGGKNARRIGFLWACSLPIFVNGTMWGQTDGILALLLLVATAYMVADRPLAAGITLGIALSFKVQSVVVAPVLIVYALRKFGWQQTLKAGAAGIIVLLLIALPFVLGGAGKQVVAAYKDAAGYYHLRAMNSMNLYGVLHQVDVNLRHLDPEKANDDRMMVIGPLTVRDVGIIALASYLILVCVQLWRRPTRDSLTLAVALSSFGFFMLSTQMHERYIAPAAALLILPALVSNGRFLVCLGVGLVAFMNQFLVLIPFYYNDYVKKNADIEVNPSFYKSMEDLMNWFNWVWNTTFPWFALLSCVLFVVASAMYFWPVREPALTPGPSPNSGGGEAE